MELPVAILIVNYNGGAHLAACLEALERQSVPRHWYEVIVVDNASCDGSADVIPTRFPWVRLVRSRRNLGFAAGNNFAAQFAHSQTVILLNNDTIPDPFWLEELLREADLASTESVNAQLAPAGRAKTRPVCIASKLVFAHDPKLVNSGGLYLLRDGRGADVGFRCWDDGRYEAGGPIFAGCAAAILTQRSDAGELLDPDYFVYYEDLDAGWRSQLAGGTSRLAPRSLVRHVHGAAAGEASPLVQYHVTRNRALTSLRNGDVPLAVTAILVLMAKVPQALVRAARGRLPWANAWAVVRAARDCLGRLPRVLAERYERRGFLRRRVA